MKQFEKIRLNKPKSSVHNLSHERKFTMDMGKLTPVFLEEVIPGDKFRVNLEALIRMQPMLAPVMHRINVFTHFFFVPYRLIWNDWEDFITGGRTGELEPNFPKITGTNAQMRAAFGLGSLGDYLGVPAGRYPDNANAATPISQLPFRAYQLIYNEYYRDQNMTEEVFIPKTSTDGAVNTLSTLTPLRKRAWEKDYFTSALPWAQRGEQVRIPLIGEIDVTGQPVWTYTSNGQFVSNQEIGTGNFGISTSPAAGSNVAITGGLSGELEEATSTSITDLRRSFSLQRWLEKNARAGGRYIEQILAHFGVKSSDARLQRPEYLGGGKMPVQISEVLQMSETATSPQGNMSGHGISSGVQTGFERFFEEHGFVIGIMSILPRTAYQEGLPKIMSKFDRFDYFFPDFAHIGEQPVFKKELFLQNSGADDETFGYQERYAEYRYKFDTVHGDMRDSLDFWHMGRKFTSMPELNQSFIEADPTTRIFPVIGESDFGKVVVMTYCNFKAIRPVPKHGTPI